MNVVGTLQVIQYVSAFALVILAIGVPVSILIAAQQIVKAIDRAAKIQAKAVMHGRGSKQ